MKIVILKESRTASGSGKAIFYLQLDAPAGFTEVFYRVRNGGFGIPIGGSRANIALSIAIICLHKSAIFLLIFLPCRNGSDRSLQ